MKNQNVNNKLNFNKASVIELNEIEMFENRGNSFSLPASSLKCFTGPLADHIFTR